MMFAVQVVTELVKENHYLIQFENYLVKSENGVF